MRRHQFPACPVRTRQSAPARRLNLQTLEDRTVPAGTLGVFTSVSNVGSIVYESMGGGTLGVVAAEDGFESGSLGASWSTYSSLPTGQIQVTGVYGTASGAYALLMDHPEAGGFQYNLNEAILTVDLAGQSNALLKFSHAFFNDEPEQFAGDFSGHYNADGIAVSNDGVNWHPIFNAQSYFSGWDARTINLKDAIAGTGLTLNDSTFYIKFQQYDNFPLTTDGRGWDNIKVVKAGGPDTLSFSVDPGQTIRVAVTGSSDIQASVQLFSPNSIVGAAVASGPGAEAILPLVTAPGRLASNSAATTYRLVVQNSFKPGTVGPIPNLGDYTVRVTLNADLEGENHGGAANNSPGSAQSLEPDFIAINRAGATPAGGREPVRAAILGTTDSSPSSGIVAEREVNNPPAVTLPPVLPTAQNIDVGGWNLDDDPNFIEPTGIPHLQIDGTTDGTFDYYKFTTTADFSFGLLYLNESFGDKIALVWDTAGNIVGYSDFFGYYYVDLPTAGTYYIGVGSFNSSAVAGQFVGALPESGQPYSLLFSVLDHATNPGGPSPLAEIEPNDPGVPVVPVPTASQRQNLDHEIWVVNSDPAVPSANTLPHVRVNGTGDGTFDYYSFTVPAGGGRVVVGARDVHFASYYGLFAVYNSTGQWQGWGYNSPTGGFDFDRTLSAGTYYVGVGTVDSTYSGFDNQLLGTAPQAGDTYTLNVSVGGHAVETPTLDVYKLLLLPADFVKATITRLSTYGAKIELLDSSGAVVATGNPAPTNVDDALSYRAPFGLNSSNYYLRVTGTAANSPYNLVVTRNAEVELEGNNSLANAQTLAPTPLGGRRWVTGAIRNSSSLTAIDSGWWDASGFHNAANTNYITGQLSGQGYRSFFVFDKGALDGDVQSATLRAYNPGYISPDPTENFALFNVATDVARLQSSGFGQADIFDDLGTGATYGSRSVSAADNNQTVSIPLNAAAVAALNGASGAFALGGALTTLRPDSFDYEFVFGSSGNVAPTLEVTAPGSDVYKITVPAGFNLQVDTATPGGGSGVFANTFDPQIKVFNSVGVLVASNDNGAADGRNALLSYLVGSGGTYYVQVSASTATPAPTQGEYILSIVDGPVRPAPTPQPRAALAARRLAAKASTALPGAPASLAVPTTTKPSAELPRFELPNRPLSARVPDSVVTDSRFRTNPPERTNGSAESLPTSTPAWVDPMEGAR